MRWLTRTACDDPEPDAGGRCTRPNEPNGHADGVHVDGREYRMRGWPDTRSIPDDVRGAGR